MASATSLKPQRGWDSGLALPPQLRYGGTLRRAARFQRALDKHRGHELEIRAAARRATEENASASPLLKGGWLETIATPHVLAYLDEHWGPEPEPQPEPEPEPEPGAGVEPEPEPEP